MPARIFPCLQQGKAVAVALNVSDPSRTQHLFYRCQRVASSINGGYTVKLVIRPSKRL